MRPTFQELMLSVVSATGVASADLHRRRSRCADEARLVLYGLAVEGGYSHAEIGEHMKKDRSTITAGANALYALLVYRIDVKFIYERAKRRLHAVRGADEAMWVLAEANGL